MIAFLFETIMIWTKITKYMSDGRCVLHWPSGDTTIRRYITNEQTVYGWIAERSSRNLRSFSTNRQRYIFNYIEKHFFKVCVNRSTFFYRSYIECTNDINIILFYILIALQMHYNFSYSIFYAFTYITNNYLHKNQIHRFILK